LINNNKPAAAFVGIEEDVRLLATAVIRTATDTGERVSLRDAAARFGIDLDELDDQHEGG
jgi:hypothetical protein